MATQKWVATCFLWYNVLNGGALVTTWQRIFWGEHGCRNFIIYGDFGLGGLVWLRPVYDCTAR